MTDPAPGEALHPSHGLIARNSAFAAGFDRRDLPALGSAATVIVTCMDSRVDPARFLYLDLGEALVLRTVGGRVTDPILQQLSIISAMAGRGQTPTAVLVIHHTNCGTARFTDPAMQEALTAAGADAMAAAGLAVADPVATAAADVEQIRTSGAVPAEWLVSGHVYDVATGRMAAV
jgi:carbonic anhydrase